VRLILALIIATILGGVWVVWLGDETAWDHCQEAYRHARTSEDTLRVDRMRAPVANEAYPRPVDCGTLRQSRERQD
jgi:hypothetical protein